VKLARPLIAIVIALALQTTLARFAARVLTGVDLVLIVVTYLGLTSGPVVGLLSGTVGGLAQDALASGVVGIGGLASTIVGFLAGIIGTQFIVAQTLPLFFVFFGATVVHAVVFLGLYTILGLQQGAIAYGSLALKAVGNALVGVVLFQLTSALPGALDRRRSGRGRVRTTRLRG